MISCFLLFDTMRSSLCSTLQEIEVTSSIMEYISTWGWAGASHDWDWGNFFKKWVYFHMIEIEETSSRKEYISTWLRLRRLLWGMSISPHEVELMLHMIGFITTRDWGNFFEKKVYLHITLNACQLIDFKID